MSYNSIFGEKVNMNIITNVTLACDDDRQTGAHKVMEHESTCIVDTFKDDMSFVSHK